MIQHHALQFVNLRIIIIAQHIQISTGLISSELITLNFLLFSRTCSSSSISDTLYSTYGTALNIAQIIGIVVGSLAGAITLTIIIVVIVCVCKKKRYQGVIIRPQYPGPVQTNMMYNQAQHPWSTPAYQQPYINPAYNSNLQYPPTYPSAPAQPPRV